MLVVTRRPQERVILRLPDGQAIAVTVCSLHGEDKVRLGFEAPRAVEIFREELLDERYAADTSK